MNDAHTVNLKYSYNNVSHQQNSVKPHGRNTHSLCVEHRPSEFSVNPI